MSIRFFESDYITLFLLNTFKSFEARLPLLFLADAKSSATQPTRSHCGGSHHWVTVYRILNWRTSNIRSFYDSRWLWMTWDKKKMTQSDSEWPMIALGIVWMSHYEFRLFKSTDIALWWGPSDLEFSIYSGSVTS